MTGIRFSIDEPMAAKVTTVLTDRINDLGAGKAEILSNRFCAIKARAHPIDIWI
jgi:hypothetical protein